MNHSEVYNKYNTTFLSIHELMLFSFEIASHITQESYGLVFGFNTFLALAFQTVLTAVVADSAGLALPPREQVSK